MADAPTPAPGSLRPLNTLYLVERRDAFSVPDEEPPLTVRRFRADGCDPDCFRTTLPGTVYALDGSEFRGIVFAIKDSYPHLRKTLDRWLKNAGYKTK